MTNDISGCVVFNLVPFDVGFLFSIIFYLDVRVRAPLRIDNYMNILLIPN